MALSGSISSGTIAGGYELELRWTATQSVSANTSTVTAKLYWMSLGSSYTINSSATKTSAIQHDGGTFSTESSAGMADLNGNQEKVINTYTFTLTHNSDGTKSFSLDGYFDAEVTLGGSYRGRIDLDEKVFTLNTIPRASKLKDTTPSFTAGSDMNLEIVRYSSSFKHECEVYVGNKVADTWNWICQVAFSTSQTLLSTAFTQSEKIEIFNELNGGSSKDVKVVLQTFNGDDMIGDNTYYGTCTAPSASTISSITPAKTAGTMDVYVEQQMTLNISRADSEFTHTVKVYSNGVLIKTITGVGASTTFTLTSGTGSEQEKVYNTMKTVQSIDGNIEILTYYNGVLVRSKTDNDINFYVNPTINKPTFGTGYTYADTNTTVPTGGTVGLTGDSTKIIQSKSTVTVTIPVSARASGKNGATIVNYTAVLGGVTRTVNHSDTVNMVFPSHGAISSNSTQTLTITAKDSRGITTTTSKTVPIIPYVKPIVKATAQRTNGFDAETTLTISGSISTISVNSVNKNAIKFVQYRYKDSKATGAISTWDTWSNFTYQPTLPTYSATNVTLQLDQTKVYSVELRVIDNLDTTTVPITVSAGRPLFFLDSLKKSMGFNDFPVNENEFIVNGQMVFGANLWASTGGGIDMNNSDIVRANGIFFNDTSENSTGEGILFLKSTKPSGSLVTTDYDKFHLYDGTGYINGKPAFTSDSNILWNGVAAFMFAGQVVTPTKKMSECPNGWIIVWSDYAGTYDWVFNYVPKDFPSFSAGGGTRLAVPNGYQTMTTKYVYVSDSTISGNAENDDTGSNTAVIRYVLSY
jgi:hypothetical protein